MEVYRIEGPNAEIIRHVAECNSVREGVGKLLDAGPGYYLICGPTGNLMEFAFRMEPPSDSKTLNRLRRRILGKRETKEV